VTPSYGRRVASKFTLSPPRPPGRVSSSLVRRGLIELEEVEEVADLLVCLGGMSHRGVSMDGVAVAAADAHALEEAGLDQIRDDPLRRPLGDADGLGDVSRSAIGVARDGQQDLRVVRDEPPRLAVFSLDSYDLCFVLFVSSFIFRQ
jgi:hypothetical protein